MATSLLDAYQSQSAQLRQRLASVVQRSWPDDIAEMDRWVDHILPVALASQKQMATMTDAYLTKLAGVSRIGLDLNALIGENLRGVSPKVVYSRPAIAVYTALSVGKAPGVAKREGLVRALNISLTDLQLSKTHTARANQQARGVAHFRRVLGAGKNCELCIAASTRRYNTSDLSPIHNNCGCGVEDWDEEPPADQPEGDDGEAFTVHEHGELGPVLYARGDAFRGPDDIPSDN